MSTIEASMSMMEVMPEDARIKVMEYTQKPGSLSSQSTSHTSAVTC